MKHKQNPWVFIIGGILMLSILFTMAGQRKQNTLSLYNEPEHVEQEELVKEPEELDIPMQIYTNEEYGFSISIPNDWEEITKDGYTTFIHGPSASSLQLVIKDYDPAINLANADICSTKVAEDGKTFTSFTRTGNASYELLYQDQKNATYDYIEEVYWDRKTSITLLCTFNDANYEKIIPYYEKILNSFAWERKDPIPEHLSLYYAENPGFEVGIPNTWTIGTSSSAIVANDSDTGASMTVTMLPSEQTFDNISATDMAGLLKKGKENFMMSSYEKEKESAVVKYTYVADNIQYQEEVYAFADGKSIYFVVFDFEAGTIEENFPSTCASLFRLFPKE